MHPPMKRHVSRSCDIIVNWPTATCITPGKIKMNTSRTEDPHICSISEGHFHMPVEISIIIYSGLSSTMFQCLVLCNKMYAVLTIVVITIMLSLQEVN
jgi:hypothetical protein